MKDKAEKSVSQDFLDALKAQGVAVAKAWFKQSVRNETHLGTSETMASRQAQAMTLVPMGLLVEQKERKPVIVPLANVSYCELLGAQEASPTKRGPGRPKSIGQPDTKDDHTH